MVWSWINTHMCHTTRIFVKKCRDSWLKLIPVSTVQQNSIFSFTRTDTRHTRSLKNARDWEYVRRRKRKRIRYVRSAFFLFSFWEAKVKKKRMHEVRAFCFWLKNMLLSQTSFLIQIFFLFGKRAKNSSTFLSAHTQERSLGVKIMCELSVVSFHVFGSHTYRSHIAFYATTHNLATLLMCTV